MKKKTCMLSLVCILGLLMGMFVVQSPYEAYADSPGTYQVNGKYTITNTRLVTKCKLYTADSSLKKKTRSYKITNKTKIQTVKEDFTKVTLKGKKRAAMIKKLNKKNQTIQFKQKNGKVTVLWIV